MKTIQLYYSAIICLGLFILNLEGCSRQHNFSVSQKTKNLQPFNESNEPNELIKVWSMIDKKNICRIILLGEGEPIEIPQEMPGRLY